MVWMGGGGFLSEAGLREGAQAHGRVFGAVGGREFEFGLFGFGTLVLLQDPAARRATLVDRLRDGQDDEQGHAVEKLAEWDDFGAHFGPPLDRIGIPACVFCTKNRSDF